LGPHSNKIIQKEFYNCCIYLINIKFYFNIFNFKQFGKCERKRKTLLVPDCDDNEVLKKSSERRQISSESGNEDDDNITEVNKTNVQSSNKNLSKKLLINILFIVQSSDERMKNTDTNGNVLYF